MSKYDRLLTHLSAISALKSELTLKFSEIEAIIGNTLPKSASSYQAWWGNQAAGSQARAWMNAGFVVDNVDIKRGFVRFRRFSGRTDRVMIKPPSVVETKPLDAANENDGNFQRLDAESNAHVGREFENVAVEALSAHGIEVTKNFPIDVGIDSERKSHKFDLGSERPPILVECKSHRWTTGSNVPSAKVTVWNEAMYYFVCAPRKYRKILFVLKDARSTTGETLAQYYLRTYKHLIPTDVEIWEYDERMVTVELVHP